MTLHTPFLRENSKLRTVATGNISLRQGDSGEAVKLLQIALLHAGMSLPEATARMSKQPHGRFDAETAQAIRRFQHSSHAPTNGVVDAATLANLDSQLARAPKHSAPKRCCRTGNRKNHGRGPALQQSLVHAFRKSSASRVNGAERWTNSLLDDVELPFDIELPNGVKELTSTQQETARSVFGDSLDFKWIYLTDALGYDGNPFAMAVPIRVPGILVASVVILNVGTFYPERDLLIHELTHAWQSQHHKDPTQFMVNSLASQRAANDIPDASSYAYVPGKMFHEYAAEQIAAQVEHGAGTIVRHVASVAKHAYDRDNMLSLALPRYEIRGAPGVKG